MKKIKTILIRIRDYINASKHFKNVAKKTNSQRIFLFSTPIHRNIGDHAIVQASLEFLDDNFSEKEVVEVPRQYIDYFIKNFSINQDDIVLIHGGGFFGNLYPVEAIAFLKVIKYYRENQIIVFPQTIFIDDSKEMSYKYFESGIKEANNITFFAREAKSFKIASDSGFFTSVKMVPDIVLYMDQVKVSQQREGILVVLRDDDEITRKFNLNKFESTIKSKINVVVDKSSTMAKESISPEKRNLAVLSKITEFSKYQLVITDRLHGMIFSYLANTNCLAIDNKTKKSSEVYKSWLSEYSNINLLDDSISEEELAEIVIRILANEERSEKVFNSISFHPLRDEIAKNIRKGS